jgi:glutamine amidotransferase
LIVVLDYGMGNLGSVARAVRHLGYECTVQPNLEGASKLIVPGVGAFGAAMERIGPIATSIRRFAQDGHPLLGICLGQQLLFEESEELGSHKGLGLLRGKVKYFPPNMNLKVPHIGWNELAWTSSGGLAKVSVKGDQVYFVHSLYTECGDAADVAAWTEYGLQFASAVMRANVWGTQFHPERSGEVGLRILRSFLES